MNDSTYILDDALLASGGKRFVNYLIDYAFNYGFGYVFGLFLVVIADVLDSFGITGFGFWIYNLGQFAWIMIGIVLTLIYYIFVEGFFGISLGKLATGTIVVDENGEKPNFKVIVKRSFCRCIPFDALTFLGGSRGWHDSLSDTYVVDKKALQEEKKMFYEFKLIGIPEQE
ncbi:RDD family protein [Flavobacterium sp. DGU38]|uniref:RDD family protein n=1 Tax=Flavobacterium calami TaxID=3139144 RepID=A0ABU9ITM2_9FLAO